MIRVLNADALLALREMPTDSLDALVTDPPAGISFMGKGWDDAKGGRDEWIAWLTAIMREALRVLKPGAHGVVWALPRTSHWTATALEDAGFEIRDVITHLYGSGFPKSLNVAKAIDAHLGVKGEVIGHHDNVEFGINRSRVENGYRPTVSQMSGEITAPGSDEAKAWAGWGTALKPAAEHWILVRKPLAEKTVARNVLAYGTGGINIDATRAEAVPSRPDFTTSMNGGRYGTGSQDRERVLYSGPRDVGRFPANVVLSHHPLCRPSGKFREIPGDTRATEAPGAREGGFYDVGAAPGDGKPCGPLYGPESAETWDCATGCPVADLGDAARFFFVAKPSQAERHDALRTLSLFDADPESRPDKNNHVTVKPVALMRHLCRLVCRPGGTVLDPFGGSGTTGVAATMEGFSAILVEVEAQSAATAIARCERAALGRES